MRKLLFLLVALPVVAVAQDKTVISYNRVFVKQDKVQPFEKALTQHAQKYHTGDVLWRVSTIESGPDAGGYHITEGPTTWESMDKRGNLGAEHTRDWENNVLPLTTDKYESGYAVYRADLSTVQLTAYSDKFVITHIFYKPGYYEDTEAMIRNIKKAWEAGGQTVVVYESSASGAPQFILVYRYKDGLKERAADYMKPMKVRYESSNGTGSWSDFQKFQRAGIDHSWSEMMFYKKELSSK